MEKRIKLIDKLIHSGYQNGFWHSLIIHCIVLITMSLIYLSSVEKKTAMVLEISTVTEEYEYQEEIVELQITEQKTETQNIYPIDTSYEPTIEEPTLGSGSNEMATDTQTISSLDTDSLRETIDDSKSNKEVNEMFSETKVPKQKTNSSSNSNRATQGNGLLELVSQGTSLGNNTGSGRVERLGSGLTSSSSIEEKLQIYGARTGDIQVSLSWQTKDDIDLYVRYIGYGFNDTIFWRNKFGRSGGMLDIDMNGGGPWSSNPIENVFWPINSSPRGNFVVGVHFFRSWTRNRSVPVTIRIKTPKGVYTRDAVVVYGEELKIVETFTN